MTVYVGADVAKQNDNRHVSLCGMACEKPLNFPFFLFFVRLLLWRYLFINFFKLDNLFENWYLIDKIRY